MPEGTDSDVVEAMRVNIEREQAELEGDAEMEDAEFDEANMNDVMDDMRNLQLFMTERFDA